MIWATAKLTDVRRSQIAVPRRDSGDGEARPRRAAECSAAIVAIVIP